MWARAAPPPPCDAPRTPQAASQPQHGLRKMAAAVAFALQLLCLLSAARGAIVLPSIYGSHMVLQAGQEGEVWGMASPSAKVAVKVGEAAPLAATSSTTGRFSVTLPAMPASIYPVTIIITAGSESLVLSDVLVGSVYVCSGQSNMGLTVSATANATREIAAAAMHGDRLRIMSVRNAPAYYNVSTPQTNLSTSIPWSKPSSENIAGMSGMCYYFGVEQVQRHPSQPVGMIASAWGGTDVQVWMSPKALAFCGGAQEQRWQEVGDPLLQAAQSSSNPDIGLGYISPELGQGACPTVPSTLWNAMIAPLLPLRLQGWLWVCVFLHTCDAL